MIRTTAVKIRTARRRSANCIVTLILTRHARRPSGASQTAHQGIPQDLIENAHCIVIVPELKTAAFVFGGKYGKGYLSCRTKDRAGWSAPGTVRIEGGSVGFQIGGSSTDLIMLLLDERGADKLLASKFTLGAEGSVAAGPVGRTATAQTDAQMHADILSWSRSQGLFAGVALEGATLR